MSRSQFAETGDDSGIRTAGTNKQSWTDDKRWSSSFAVLRRVKTHRKSPAHCKICGITQALRFITVVEQCQELWEFSCSALLGMFFNAGKADQRKIQLHWLNMIFFPLFPY